MLFDNVEPWWSKNHFSSIAQIEWWVVHPTTGFMMRPL